MPNHPPAFPSLPPFVSPSSSPWGSWVGGPPGWSPMVPPSIGQPVVPESLQPLSPSLPSKPSPLQPLQPAPSQPAGAAFYGDLHSVAASFLPALPLLPRASGHPVALGDSLYILPSGVLSSEPDAGASHPAGTSADQVALLHRLALALRQPADRHALLQTDTATRRAFTHHLQQLADHVLSGSMGPEHRVTFYAAAATILEVLVTAGRGDPLVMGAKPLDAAAMALGAQLMGQCDRPRLRTFVGTLLYRAVRELPLSTPVRQLFEAQVRPYVAPSSPDYNAIYQGGRKQTLNIATYFGDEVDDAIYRGGLARLRHTGHREVDSDVPGFRLFVRDVPGFGPCRQVRHYVTQHRDSSFLTGPAIAQFDVVRFDGHSELGRNLRKCVARAQDAAGWTLVIAGACNTDESFDLMSHAFPDPTKVQFVVTTTPTQFGLAKTRRGQRVTWSENGDMIDGLVAGMAQAQPWALLNQALERATRYWLHDGTRRIYAHSGDIETVLWRRDADRDGKPDLLGDRYYDPEPVQVPKQPALAFVPQAPPAGTVDGTTVHMATQSLRTLGRYNSLLKPYCAAQGFITSAGMADLGEHGPRLQLRQAGNAWRVVGNSWYAHAPHETVRAELFLKMMELAIARGHQPQSAVRYETQYDAWGMPYTVAVPATYWDAADQRLFALMFVAASLEEDMIDPGTAKRAWYELLQACGYPPVPWEPLRDLVDNAAQEHETWWTGDAKHLAKLWQDSDVAALRPALAAMGELRRRAAIV